jgi:endonuclease YncB( thermonuclease family)
VTFGPYHALVVSGHDGDTVDLDIRLQKRRFRLNAAVDLGFNVQLRRDGVWLAKQPVRTFGDNADELRTPGGKAALDYLQTLIKPGDPVTLLSEGFDKYAPRIDGTITLADGRDLVQTMIAAGHAVAWNGQGSKPTI